MMGFDRVLISYRVGDLRTPGDLGTFRQIKGERLTLIATKQLANF